uniref:non-specific serine/threonine protein kinase n=1 Tax=Strongyloides venezuelensis TaxID=75913 RepID=A0A0K0FV83_STRVS
MNYIKDIDIQDLQITNLRLGNGSYGSVKLVYSIKNKKELYAYKRFKLFNYNVFKNEFKIMNHLYGHPNIIGLLGTYQGRGTKHIGMILEFANGGNLLKKITPNIGMPVLNAWGFFINLLNAVSYIHSKGIAHRDIKPENLLICNNNVLKLADFGCSAYFIMNGKRRKFMDIVGSPAYMPLEVYYPPYEGEPNDIWQCGIVLFAMLTGKLPWKKASTLDDNFARYIMGKMFKLDICTGSIGLDALSLISEILCIIPEKRTTLRDIAEHRFVKNHPQRNCNNDHISKWYHNLFNNGNLNFSLTGPT